jgi:hypothetical protein
VLAALFEQVAHPRGADPDEHLDEFGAADREERHPGLAGHGARDQGLARAGRADQQHALRHAPTEPAVLLGVFQEGDDFLQFFLRFVDAGDIVEGDLGVLLHIDLGLGFADRHHAAADPAAHPANREHPDAEEDQHGNGPGENVADHRALDPAGEFDAVFGEVFGKFGIDSDGDDFLGSGSRGILEKAADVPVGD